MDLLPSPKGIVHEDLGLMILHLFILVFYRQAHTGTNLPLTKVCVGFSTLLRQQCAWIFDLEITAINTGIPDNWGAVVLQKGPYGHQPILRMYFKSPLESHLKTKKKTNNQPPQKNPKKPQWEYWDLMIDSYPVTTFCLSFSLSFSTAKLPHYRSSVINHKYTVWNLYYRNSPHFYSCPYGHLYSFPYSRCKAFSRLIKPPNFVMSVHR